MDVTGDQVYQMYRDGRLAGDQRLLPVRHARHLLRLPADAGADRRPDAEQEHDLVQQAQEFLEAKSANCRRCSSTWTTGGEISTMDRSAQVLKSK